MKILQSLKNFVKPLMILLIILAVLGAGHHVLKWIFSTNGLCDVCGKEAADIPEKLEKYEDIDEELCKDCIAKLENYVK